jgi:hypothetical protein
MPAGRPVRPGPQHRDRAGGAAAHRPCRAAADHWHCQWTAGGPPWHAGFQAAPSPSRTRISVTRSGSTGTGRARGDWPRRRPRRLPNARPGPSSTREPRLSSSRAVESDSTYRASRRCPGWPASGTVTSDRRRANPVGPGSERPSLRLRLSASESHWQSRWPPGFKFSWPGPPRRATRSRTGQPESLAADGASGGEPDSDRDGATRPGGDSGGP